jgi:hypothetical protein
MNPEEEKKRPGPNSEGNNFYSSYSSEPIDTTKTGMILWRGCEVKMGEPKREETIYQGGRKQKRARTTKDKVGFVSLDLDLNFNPTCCFMSARNGPRSSLLAQCAGQKEGSHFT